MSAGERKKDSESPWRRVADKVRAGREEKASRVLKDSVAELREASMAMRRQQTTDEEAIRRFSNQRQRATDYLRKAVEADEKYKRKDGTGQAAYDAYVLATNRIEQARCTLLGLSEQQKRVVAHELGTLLNYYESAMERQLCLKNELTENTLQELNVVDEEAARNRKKKELLRGVDSQIGPHLLDDMLGKTGITLADVLGCEQAKEALEEAVLLPSLNPNLFKGLRKPNRGILLFGPPGNSKTLLARAIAGEANQTFFNISASSLTSKWVGEGEKTVRALFQIARNAQPCIVFIDEIDSILCERKESEQDSSRRLKTEFLIQFDGAGSSPDDRIIILAATNRPQELDDAVLRRFPRRIFLDLPDQNGRFHMIKSTLTKHSLWKGLTDQDAWYVASRTGGYSYSDLAALCKEAAMVPLRDVDRKKLAAMDADKIRNLKTTDFDKAMTVVKPSTSQRQLDTIKSFASRAGQIC